VFLIGLLVAGTADTRAGPGGGKDGGVGGDLGCDTKSHVMSELVEEGWLMPGT
jgi:hypothetical protein